MKRLLGVLLLALVACGGRQSLCTNDRQRVSEMVDRTRRVEVECPDGRRGWGSGVILGPAHHNIGYMVVATAAHVVKKGCSHTIRTQPAVEIARDEEADVSLLLTPGFAWYLESTRPWLGMPVVAVGWPNQLKDDEGHLQVSRGWLLVDFGDRYKVSAQGFFGSSGGPVFDENGRLLGLLVSINVLFGMPVDGHYYVTPAARVVEMYEALR